MIRVAPTTGDPDSAAPPPAASFHPSGTRQEPNPVLRFLILQNGNSGADGQQPQVPGSNFYVVRCFVHNFLRLNAIIHDSHYLTERSTARTIRLPTAQLNFACFCTVGVGAVCPTHLRHYATNMRRRIVVNLIQTRSHGSKHGPSGGALTVAIVKSLSSPLAWDSGRSFSHSWMVPPPITNTSIFHAMAVWDETKTQFLSLTQRVIFRLWLAMSRRYLEGCACTQP